MKGTLSTTARYLEEVDRFSAHNYAPLPVVLARGEDVWVWDVEGRKYLDMLSAYSAVNQGHCHPRIVAAANEQLARITLTSRAFHNDQMGPFLRQLCELTGYGRALPMNTGAEAVETAIKMVRKWGYLCRGVAADQAEIIVCEGNFAGRTTTVISFSSEEAYRAGFGPFTPGFKIVPYGDLDALAAAIGPNTVGFMFEPIQGEGGVVVPPDGYIAGAAALCQERGIALMADEIQTGLGRCGKLFCTQWEDVRPDVIMIGKALSGGLYPVSAVLSDDTMMGVFKPGDHGSTFGGNPFGAAIARAALAVLVEERLPERAAEAGAWFIDRLRSIDSDGVVEVRGRGLMIGVEMNGPARPYCEALQERGILAKETHKTVIRFAPPLTIDRETLAWAADEIEAVLTA